MFLDTENILVHMADVIAVRKDEGLFGVETKGQNVLDIILAHLERTFGSVKINFRLVNVFLIISDLNDKRNIEDPLQPLCENKWDAMTHVECIS